MPEPELTTTRWRLDAECPGVAVLTLSRPDRHNAWTGRMHTEIRHLFQRAEDDPDVRVVVVTGDPDGRAFCPGADTRALEGHVARGAYDPGTADDLADPGYGVRPEFDADFAWFLGLETVTIAAVNGAAAGVGLVLACWCDLRVVADDAKLTAAHGRLNLPAEYGLSWLLPRLVGLGPATELLLSSRVVQGDEAQRLGLAHEVRPRDEVLPAALERARDLVRTVSPHALRATKRQLAVDAVRSSPAESVRDAQARLEQMVTEADFAEGTAALGERRPPRWSGA